MGCPAIGWARQMTGRDRNRGDVRCVQAAVSVMAFPFSLGRGKSQKRAVKAENHVLKLRQEVSLLQVTSKRASPVRV